MSNIINRIKKDTQIIECKKRAKEILREYLNRKASLLSKELTLMQCLEIAAKEMNYNSWYELRQNIKNKEIKNEHILSNYTQEWDKFVMDYFENNYESLHFEVRGMFIKLRARKYGIMGEFTHNFSTQFITQVLKELNISYIDFGWLSKDKYNIQTVPAYTGATDISYDLIVVKKDYMQMEKLKTLKSENNVSVKEKLNLMGFNKNNILDILNDFENKSFFIAGLTGSGRSKTAEVIVEELKKRKHKICEIKESMTEKDIQSIVKFGLKSDSEYFYFPDFRSKEIGSMISNLLDSGHKVITTTHAYSIDAIENRMKELGLTLLKPMNNCFIYQNLEALLCPCCKENEFSFKKILQNEGFMNYVKKHEKHEIVEKNLYKRGNYENCKNKSCYQGYIGRKVIAETFNVEYEEKENPSKYIRYHVMTNEEKQLTKSYEKLKQGKVSEFLKLNSQDFSSNRYEEILKGQIEL